MRTLQKPLGRSRRYRIEGFNPFMPTVALNICCPRDCVSRHNGGTTGAPLKPLRDDSALRALSSLGQQMLNVTVGKNGLIGPSLCQEALTSRTVKEKIFFTKLLYVSLKIQKKNVRLTSWLVLRRRCMRYWGEGIRGARRMPPLGDSSDTGQIFQTLKFYPARKNPQKYKRQENKKSQI